MMTIKNCQLTDGQAVDIQIANGKIQKVGSSLTGGEEIDIEGKLVMPGIIDAHVHFREPGGEYKEDWLTGSRAAVAGGVTTVIDMPNNNPPAIDNKTLDKKRGLAEKSLVNYGFYFGATKDNITDIQEAQNIAGVKIYVGSSTGNLLVSEDEDIKNLFLLPNIQWVVHAEDEYIIKRNQQKFTQDQSPSIHSKIRDRQTAIQAIKRVISLAQKTNTRIHICHVSTKEEIELIKQAKEQGLDITCEVSPHHLFLNEAAYAKLENLVKVNPPLRTPQDNGALWEGLKKGIIDIIATDHAPHTIDEKRQGYSQAPAGIPEVQTSLPLMLNAVHEKKITLEQLEYHMATRPAEIFRLEKWGRIKEGCYADLTVIDLNLTKKVLKKELKSKCGWSPYEGQKLTGWPVMTFVNGHLVFNNGKINEQYKGKEISYGKI